MIRITIALAYLVIALTPKSDLSREQKENNYLNDLKNMIEQENDYNLLNLDSEISDKKRSVLAIKIAAILR
ncbi:MAG: hypothetical protein JOZ78_17450 [Chroococcidiopsidaceae cyanobacterium CP_BM_ER_R8_30]|nr:hypothetical protein [Chroococcidiopsidaceae cyanobacterium CP_BM_ER_R8_30]